MKPVLCMLYFFGCYAMVAGQAVECNGEIRDLKWWDKKKLNSFPKDRDQLYFLIDNLNTGCIQPLKDSFDQYRNSNNPASVKSSNHEGLMEANMAAIKAAPFYTGTQLCEAPFLYFYSNKELNDYIHSIEALKVETKRLYAGAQEVNVFKNIHFLSAYFNFTQSRSLLLAAIGDIDRYFMLGKEVDATKMTASHIDTVVNEVKTTADSTKMVVDSVKEKSQQIVTNLESEFVPAMPLKSAKNKALVKANPGKINTAANTILVDNRKNGWWRGIAGGLIGGIVAGVIIAAAN